MFNYDVRHLVEITYGSAIYNSYCNCVFNLKMAYKADMLLMINC